MQAALFLPRCYSAVIASAWKRTLTPRAAGDETHGRRLAGVRRERGKLRRNVGMILRFATALEVSTDALLQPAGPVESKTPGRRVLHGLEQIESLPSTRQIALLSTIDTFLEGAAGQAARRA